jgi:23S rRNA (guanosine2251-2'-O)-methyltransferase
VKQHESHSSTDENIVYGRNAVLELLLSGKAPDTVYIQDFSAGGNVSRIIAVSKELGATVKQVSAQKLEFLTNGGNHQGVAATTSLIEYVSLRDILDIAREKGEAPFLVIADEIEDPHNLGALIRTAEAAGAHGLVIPKRRSATVNSTVYKTSAGACAHLAVAKVTNIAETIETLKKEGVWVYGADRSGTPLWQADISGSAALVVGSEGKGLGTLVKKRCDALVSIPMNGKINSLNASVAGGIFMYELVRQRNDRSLQK